MGAFSVSGIAENVTEEFIEDGISELVHAMGNCYFGDGKNSPECANVVDAAFSEALEGATQMLKFSIMTAVIYRVSEYAMVRIVAGSGFIYAWIKKRRVLQALKSSADKQKRNAPKSFFGRFGAKLMGFGAKIVNDTQSENLAVAQMANNNLNNVTQLIAQERQTATMQSDSQRKQLMSTLGINHDAKGFTNDKRLEAYNYKMKTGTWTTSTDDKKLFTDVIPRQYIKDGFIYNSSFVDSLNSFTEYAKTKENEIVNLTEILAKTLATKGAI